MKLNWVFGLEKFDIFVHDFKKLVNGFMIFFNHNRKNKYQS